MNNNIIVTERASSMRALGREALRGNWKSAAVATLVYMAALLIPTEILNLLFGNGNLNSGISGIYSLIVTGPFTFGYTMYCLNLFRRKDAQIAEVFYGFEKFGKTLGLYLYMVLFIFLWSLLFVVPGIIAAFRYSQAFVVLADHPEYSVFDCMDESKRMMKGNKGKLFCIEISFIGWCVLACIPAGAITGIIAAIIGNPMSPIITIVSYIGCIGYLWLTPYMMVTAIGFYEILQGNLRPGTVEANFTTEDYSEPTTYVESEMTSEPTTEPATESAEPIIEAEPQATETLSDEAEEPEDVTEEKKPE